MKDTVRYHEIIERYREGTTLREVAEEFGVTYQRVHQVIARFRDLYRGDLSGLVFGWLRVIGPAEVKVGRNSEYPCTCKCGVSVSVRREKLITGRQRSCGCRRADTQIRRKAAASIPDSIKRARGKKGGRTVRLTAQWKRKVEIYLAG